MTDAQFVEAAKFNIKKFLLNEEKSAFDIKTSQNSSGLIRFPKYDYDSNKETLSILSDEIEISYGGVPRIDEKWRPTDDKCLYVWIPLCGRGNIKNKGGKSLLKVFQKIDKLTQDKIDEKKGTYLSCRTDGKTSKSPKSSSISYSKCIKEYTPNSNNDDDDDDDKDESEDEDENKEHLYRIKAKIEIKSKWDSKNNKIDNTIETEITTKVYDNKKKQIKIKTLDDLRNQLKYGATVALQIDLVKTFLGVNKITGTDKRLLCHTLVLKQVMIINPGSGGGVNKIVSASVFNGMMGKNNSSDEDSDDDDSDNDKKKNNKNAKKNDSSDEESDSDKKKKKSKKNDSSDEESDSDKKKKKSKKNDSSDEESDSDKKKKKSKKNDSSDEESDSDKKKKKSKKDNSSDEESDDDKKKKKLITKNKESSSEEDSDSDSD